MTCFYTTLPGESLLHLQGPDARGFLQGQLTCDTRLLAPERTLPGTACTVQGRVICDVLLYQLAPEHLVLRLRRDIRAVSAAVLARYIVFSKATLEPEREDWSVAACWGEGAAQALREVFGTVPGSRYGACAGPRHMITQLDDAGCQFECLLEDSARAEFSALMQAHGVQGDENPWRALQIEAGIARIEAATSGEYIPQMLNYDLTGHISFNKGCYTGQEVVARMHYRGKPKRRLYRARFADGAIPQQLPAPGDPLLDSDDTRSIGNVVNLARDERDQPVLLITATVEALAGGLHLAGNERALLLASDPPYSLG